MLPTSGDSDMLTVLEIIILSLNIIQPRSYRRQIRPLNLSCSVENGSYAYAVGIWIIYKVI
jgi:hypothetical protein